jgi:hypothetical protein
MTLPNRIDPFGRRLALPGRGLLTGNRGALVGATGTISRASAARAWISCTLVYGEARQPLVQPRTWTPLFFLDEATALAASHRPCARCRRDAFRALTRALGGLTAPDLDQHLARERASRAVAAPPRLRGEELTDWRTLPPGTMVAADTAAWLVSRGGLQRWSMAGYAPPLMVDRPVTVLTPPTLVRALAEGYRPLLHGSAA